MSNPRCYAIDGFVALSSSAKTALTLVSATTIRPEIYDVVLGFSSAPADNALTAYIQRFTAAGTVTAVTPVALDPADPASLAASGENASGEPTYTANAILLRIAMNQRATHRWIADPGRALKFPATANNGGGLWSLHASATPTLDALIHFNE